MKRLILVISFLCFSLAAYAQTASVSMTSDSATCTMGTVTIGEASAACDITVTNGTGGNFTWRDYANAALQQTAGAQGTLQFDGDAYAKIWGDSCNPNYGSGANPHTWTFNNASTCHISAYLISSVSTGTSTGNIYLVNAAGTILSTITLSGTGAADNNTTIALPVGINADYSGTVMDTTYAGDAACTGSHVTTGAQLTSALAAANQGDTICITKGSAISGQFTLRATGDPTASWITIRCAESGSSALCTGIPAENNIICQPADLATNYKTNCTTMAANMAKVTNSLNPSATATFTMANGAHHYRIMGLELAGSETFRCSSGYGSYVIFDRNYIHDDGLTGFGNVISGCDHFAFINNWNESDSLSEIQVLAFADGSIVNKVVNNVIIGTGGIIVGGEIGRANIVQPTDFEIRGNHFFRPMQWNPYCTGSPLPSGCGGVAWDGNSRAGGSKSLLEFKEGQRILVYINKFAQAISQQNYAAYLYSPGDQHGNNIFARVADVTSDYNELAGSNVGMLVTGGGFAWTTLPTKRVLIQNHLMYNICGSVFPSAWASGNGSTCSLFVVDAERSAFPRTRPWQAVDNLTIQHATALDGNWTPYDGRDSINCVTAFTYDTTRFTFRNNITGSGAHVNCAEGNLRLNATLAGAASSVLNRNLLLDPVDSAFVVTPGSPSNWKFNWGTANAWASYFIYGGAQSNAHFIGGTSTPYLIQPATTYSGWAADSADPGIASDFYTKLACIAAGNCGATAPANPSVAPTPIDFGTQTVGTPSAPTTVTLTNNTGSSLTITSVALLTGTDFAITNNCSSPLASPGSCTVLVTCNATSAAVKTDTLRFTDSGGNSPQDVALTCTGTIAPPPTPTASLSCTPSFLILGNFFTCTPTTTNATSCSTTNVGPVGCSGTFTFNPSTIGSFSLTLTATGAGGSADATPVVVYTQKQPTSGGIPF